jgi:dipeptidyl aminopeptidase/acylaminoacyl peptidase
MLVKMRVRKEQQVFKEPQTQATALWKARYRADGIWHIQLACQAPSRGLVVTTTSGTGQLYAWDVLSKALRPLTSRQEGVFSGLFSPDGRAVYYLRDEAGSEIGHYVRIPWEGGAEQDLTPDMPPYAAISQCAVSANGAMFAFTPAETESFPLYCLELQANGTVSTPRELYRSSRLIDDVALSGNAEMVVVATAHHARQYSLVAIDTTTGQHVGELSDLPEGSVRAVLFSPLPDDTRLVCLTNRSGFVRPLIWDPHRAERRDVSLGALEGDIVPLDWSLDGKRLLLLQTAQAVQHLYTYDLTTSMLMPLQHPAGSYAEGHFGPMGQILAVWSDATHPPQVIALESETGAWQGTVLAIDEAPPARPITSVSFPSSDGTAIQGWLGLPEGPGPFPAVLLVHGGPHVVITESYDPEGQSWLDRGCACLTINYRGSTTFGRAFQEQIWGNLGQWEIEDLVAARDWLVRQGIARPEAMMVTGASYGGYLTLLALGKHLELWAGGMAQVAYADLLTAFYAGTDWSRGYLTAMLGGTPEEKLDQYVTSSPLTYVEQTTAPVLVIQGRHDLRCPPLQMQRYAEQMQALGKPFEIDWFDGGHMWVGTEQTIAFQERILRFAHRILSPRGG